MKLGRAVRIALALLLTLTGIGTLWSVWVWSLRAQLDLGALLILLGDAAVLGFCALLVKDLLRKKPVSRGALTIGVCFGLATALLVAAILGGLYLDVIGEQCRGLMGSSGSCLFGPQLFALIILFAPGPMAVIGAIASVGIFSQLSTKKRLAENKAA